jgi:hypothetical protein
MVRLFLVERTARSLDTSSLVSTLDGINRSCPVGEQHPRHSFTRRHLIERTQFLRESAFQAPFQCFAILGFKQLHAYLDASV